MARWIMLGLLAMGVVERPAAGQADGQAPAYQRNAGHQGHAPDHGRRPDQRRGPDYGRRPDHDYGPRHGQDAAVSAGTFQRPYPYHLDFYKQKYGGSYEPYFGNLYGPPNVVLGGVYGGYGAPAYPGPYGYQPPAGYPAEMSPPYEAAPAATQAILCPHCQQPIYLAAPPEAGEP